MKTPKSENDLKRADVIGTGALGSSGLNPAETPDNKVVMDPDFPPADLYNAHYTTAPPPGEAPGHKEKKLRKQTECE